jgi:hypothetical protein
MKQHLKLWAFGFAMVFMLSRCDVFNPNPANDGEVITTVKLNFTQSSDTTQKFTATFKDADGTGGAAPTIFDEIVLKPNTQYRVQMELLNETNAASPVNIGTEIENEATDHQFFFTPAGALVQFTYNDTDTKGNPVGLRTFWQAGSASTGTVKIVLKHQPNQKPNAPGDATIGDTDIELNFVTKIQ